MKKLMAIPGAACRRAALIPPLLLAAAFWFGGGCSSSTGPEVEAPRVTFAPAADTIRTTVGSTVNFSVTVADLPDAQIVFSRDDLVLGTTPNLSYQVLALGVVRLRAKVTGGDRVWERVWTIIAGEVDRPPAVLNLALADGLAPSRVLVTWRRPADLSWPVPLAAYELAVRAGTPPTAQDWASWLVASVPVGPPAESREYGEADSGAIIPDAQVYVGVRTVDQEGNTGPIASAGPWRVTRAWEIEGTVLDDRGAPLSYISLDYGCDTCRVITDGDGRFRFGPLRERDAHTLRTLAGAGYYDFQTLPLTIDTPMPLSLGVIERRTLSAACAASAYPGPNGFFDLLRDLTKTDQTWDNRSDYTLLKWDSYPVPVHVAEGQGTGGFDLRLAAIEAVGNWNAALGGGYLTLVDAPPAVGITIVFASLPYPGLTELIEPGEVTINEAVPRRIQVTINPVSPRRDVFVSITTHELGHALGLGAHSDCQSHLMTYSFTSGLEITDDEVQVMLSVRHLPQATPMDRYLR